MSMTSPTPDPAGTPAEEKAVSVLAIDDNPQMVESLERMIRHTPGLRWAGGVTGESEFRSAMARHSPELVVMDMQMPGVDTFSLLQQVAKDFPATRVLMLSGHLQREYVLGSIDAGAFGYVGKHRSPDYIAQAMRRVAAGEFFVCPDAAASAGLA